MAVMGRAWQDVVATAPMFHLCSRQIQKDICYRLKIKYYEVSGSPSPPAYSLAYMPPYHFPLICLAPSVCSLRLVCPGCCAGSDRRIR
eukprot:2705696-Rhodomonas_salina.7